MFLQYWHLWNTQRYFSGLLMRCRFSENSWEYYVFDFGLCVSEICLFLYSSLMRFFCGTIFFIFQDSVWLVNRSWWVHCCSNHQFCWIGDRCRSRFALWWFFVRKKICRHKLVVYTSFWSWLLNVSSVLTSLKKTATFFWVVNALWVFWKFMGILSFWFLS